jgi:tRNA nucleotidyltransferase (CCA-adding enzyme)
MCATTFVMGCREATHEIGVIKLNPEQSKHLETATLKVCGRSVDVNNLRSEVYEENSRIPTMV